MLSGKVKIIVSILGLVCAGLIISGVYFYVNENTFLNQCRLIKCRVTSIEEPVRGKAIILFKDTQGSYKPFYYTENYDPSEYDLEYKINEIYEVYYYQPDPNRSEVKDFIANHTVSFILFMIAVSFIFDIPVYLFFSAFKRKNILKQQQYGIKGEVISE